MTEKKAVRALVGVLARAAYRIQVKVCVLSTALVEPGVHSDSLVNFRGAEQQFDKKNTNGGTNIDRDDLLAVSAGRRIEKGTISLHDQTIILVIHRHD